MTCFDVEEKDDECKVQVIIVAFDDSLSHNPPLALKGQTCVYKLSERATRGPALFFFFFFPPSSIFVLSKATLRGPTLSHPGRYRSSFIVCFQRPNVLCNEPSLSLQFALSSAHPHCFFIHPPNLASIVPFPKSFLDVSPPPQTQRLRWKTPSARPTAQRATAPTAF